MKMPNRFQACRGPSGTRAHIRDTQARSLLVLCETTAPALDLHGAIAAEVLCGRCIKKMVLLIAADNIKAELIGCAEII